MQLQVLKDDEKRQMYDQVGREQFESAEAGGMPGGGMGGFQAGPGMGGFSMGGMGFETFFRGAGMGDVSFLL